MAFDDLDLGVLDTLDAEEARRPSLAPREAAARVQPQGGPLAPALAPGAPSLPYSGTGIGMGQPSRQTDGPSIAGQDGGPAVLPPPRPPPPPVARPPVPAVPPSAPGRAGAPAPVHSSSALPPSIPLRTGPNARSLREAFSDFIPDLNVPLEGLGGAAELPVTKEVISEAVLPQTGPGNKLQLLVSQAQKGNPMLSHVKHAWVQFANIEPDFIVGKGVCALYISLRYHAIKPDYLSRRLKRLGRDFRLRLILVQVDMEDGDHLLLEIQRLAIFGDATVVCAFSLEEAARYLETFKTYENKPATVIQARTEDAYLPKVQDVLTAIRSVNKTDVLTLLSNFGSVADIFKASVNDLASCPGFGEKKVRRVVEALATPMPGSGGGGGGGGGRKGEKGVAVGGSSRKGESGGAPPPAPPAAAPAAGGGSGAGGKVGDDDDNDDLAWIMGLDVDAVDEAV